MPIYEYHCKKCRADFEVLVRGGSENVNCEKCGSAEVERKLSTFAPSVPGTGCKEMAACPAAAQGACGCGCGCGHQHQH